MVNLFIINKLPTSVYVTYSHCAQHKDRQNISFSFIKDKEDAKEILPKKGHTMPLLTRTHIGFDFGTLKERVNFGIYKDSQIFYLELISFIEGDTN